MLTHLHIRDLAVIGEATVEPAPGLTVVTGETGAGKTLVVTGLGLLLGGRTDAGMVRHGCSKAVVEGRFTGLAPVADRLEQLGAQTDDDGGAPELLVTRQLTSAGRARAFVGGVQVPLGTLGDVVGELATIHGQLGQARLASPEHQREVLDRAAGPGLTEALASYRSRFAARRAALAERAELLSNAQARAREADMLRFGLAEIEAVGPQPGEDDELAGEARRLQDVDDLRALAQLADQALSGGDDGDTDGLGAVGLTGQAHKALLKLAGRDAAAGHLVGAATTALDGVSALGGEVASYLSSLEADPLRLEAVVARRAQLQALTRKYGATIDEVLVWAQTAAKRLTDLVHGDDRIEVLTSQIADLDDELAGLAQTISGWRTQAASHLESAVQLELAALAMPHASLRFALEPLPELGPWGAESVHLQFSANAGSPAGPLAKVASGGELSRVRLALEVVIASLGEADGLTFVFDEVDAGVGGAVGLEIGRRLARLAQDAQVIVVTHLAQVAAWADRHFLVSKSDDGEVTTAGVRELIGQQRVTEIARMMGGLSSSQAGLGHAADLLAAARL